MRKWVVTISLLLVVIVSVSFIDNAASLRRIYSRSPDKWPKPFVEPGVEWTELGLLPESPLRPHIDSLKHIIELGKILFFDPRLSSSGKISCATCHQPELSWTDGKPRSVGHDGAMNKRNSPTIQNSWFYKKLFWDGRARDLEDQAFAPINSESEMHNDMAALPRNLKAIKGYAALFASAYGDDRIDPHRITSAIAAFERTIISRKSKFDEFLMGNRNALTNEELRGLHLFRTKASCMNCHNGPLFRDNRFHQPVLRLSANEDDKGLYNVTHNDADVGKFRTPSLRDVTKTGPWMHEGAEKDLRSIIDLYDKNSPAPFGSHKQLGLSDSDKKDLLAFLHAISSPPVEFKRPIIPE